MYRWTQPPARMRLELRPNCPILLFPRNTLLRQIHETQHQASTSQQQATEILVQNAWKNSLKDFPNQKLIILNRFEARLPLHRVLWEERTHSPCYRRREALRKSRPTYPGKTVMGAQGRVYEDHTGETVTLRSNERSAARMLLPLCSATEPTAPRPTEKST